MSRLAATLAGLAAAVPWLLGFSDSRAAVAGGIAFAMTVGPIALLADVLPAAAYAVLAAGAWLAASPWALGYASPAAAVADVVVGALLAVAGRRALRCPAS
jgi:SPW repeat